MRVRRWTFGRHRDGHLASTTTRRPPHGPAVDGSGAGDALRDRLTRHLCLVVERRGSRVAVRVWWWTLAVKATDTWPTRRPGHRTHERWGRRPRTGSAPARPSGRLTRHLCLVVRTARISLRHAGSAVDIWPSPRRTLGQPDARPAWRPHPLRRTCQGAQSEVGTGSVPRGMGKRFPRWNPSTEVEMPDRILVVANETCPGAELRRAVLQLAGGKPSEVMVIAPAVNGWLQTWATDVDDAIDAARLRVQEAVKALRDEGLQASGDVGDGNPLVAIEDARPGLRRRGDRGLDAPAGPLALALARPRGQGAEAVRAARHARRRRPRARHRQGAGRPRA